MKISFFRDLARRAVMAAACTAALVGALHVASAARAADHARQPIFAAPSPTADEPSPASQPEVLQNEVAYFEDDGAAPEVTPVSYNDPNVMAAEPFYQRSVVPEGVAMYEGYAPRPFLPWGPWRQVRADMTWVDSTELAFADLEPWAIFAFPTISEDTPLVLTPGAGVHFVNVADGLGYDLPQHLYDLYIDVMLRHRFSSMPALSVDVAVTPGVYSDFKTGSGDDAFRLGGRIVGDYRWDDYWTIRAGVAYLDREDVDFLPVGGVIYKPNADTIFDLTSPKPRFSRCFYRLGGTERWWHIGGEFGGGSWSIRRDDGTNDVASYYDLRLTAGITQKSKCGPSGILEAGYVFARQLEFRNGGTFEPESGLMLRAAVGY